MIDLINIADTIRYKGLEFFNRYYSAYDAIVHDNKDPEKRGRLKVSVPSLWGTDIHDYWAQPGATAIGTDAGIWFIPKIGDRIKVTFRKGNQQYPVWQYGDTGSTDNSLSAIYNADGEPTGAIIKTYSGHSISLLQQDDKIEIKHQSGATVTLNTNDLSLVSGSQQILLDNFVKLITDSQVRIGTANASNPLVKGNELDSLLTALFTAIKSLTVVVSGAAGSVSPATIGQIEIIENTLQSLIKSNRVYTDQ